MNQSPQVTTCTVSEQLGIDEEKLEEWSELNDYWESSYKFYLDHKDDHVDDLSVGQMSWMRKIERSIQEDNPENWD